MTYQSLTNKYMNTPNSLIERKIQEYQDGGFWRDRAWDSTEIFLKQALLEAQQEAQQEARREAYEDLFREIKDYDFKENHICGFNDGKQDCDCFIAGLNVALQIIKKEQLNTSSDGEFC